MGEFPRSLIEFQQRFADEAACAAYLCEARWPGGFVCPACGGVRGWELATKAWTHECAECGKQTSVTAGTVLHGSKLPLTVWFWAAYLMATPSSPRFRSKSNPASARTAPPGCCGQTAPRHGRAGTRPADRPGRGRRDVTSLP